METISFDDFWKVDIRVGTILSAAPNPKARKPAYVLQVDFGPEVGVKTSSAQITDHYQPADLVGLQVVGVVNLEAKRVAGVKSEVLILGSLDEQGRVILVTPTQVAHNGERVG
jgi:tRNA-binding protein